MFTLVTADAKTTYSYVPSKMTLNGQQISTPSHITAKDPFSGANTSMTSFLPIWYTDVVLQDTGITPTWDGHTLNLQVPSSVTVNYPTTPSPMTLSPNVMAIEINGKVVTYAPKIAYNDNGSSTITTFCSHLLTTKNIWVPWLSNELGWSNLVNDSTDS